MPSKAFKLAESIVSNPIMNDIVTNTTAVPATITTQIATSTDQGVSTVADLPDTGNNPGDIQLVEATNRLYVWNGSGWYNIALINQTPTWDSGGQPSTSYILDADSPQDATVITLAASDPDGLPISYSYVASGSMDSMATISQDSSVFTVTPKTVSEVGEGVELTGSITFRASDGVNILPQVSSFTLNFITIIENSRYTTLLATAVDTSDNNDITDSSTNNYTITVNGDAHAGTFSPYRHGGYSTYFPDSGWGPYTDNVIAPSSDFAFGTGAFTVSFWYKFEHSFSSEIFDTRQTSVNMNGFRIWIGPAGGATVYYATSTVLTATTTAAVGVWGHICVTRDGSGNLKIFLNGTQAASTTDNNNYTAQGLNIGNSNSGINDFRGWMKDIHVVKGYSYEPDTVSIYSPAKVGVGTVFLGCTTASMQDVSTAARIISSSIGFTYTTEVPNNNLEYSAAIHGGSVSFNGTTDFFTLPQAPALGSSHFEVSLWVYSSTTDTILIDWADNNGGIRRYNAPHLSLVSGSLNWFVKNTSGTNITMIADTSTIPLNSWVYVTVKRYNGDTKMYVNGVQVGSTYSTNIDFVVAPSRPIIGRNGYNSSVFLAGNIADLTVKIGTDVTDGSAPTVPTAPVSSTGTALHVKGTDASIIDKSQASNLKLVGNTTGSTTQVKFADTKSMYFDGAGDYITADQIPLGTGDFTIEAYTYLDSRLTIYPGIFGNYSTFSAGSLSLIAGHQSSTVTNYQVAHNGTFPTLNAGPITYDQWVHLCLERYNGTITLYKDGTSIGSFSSTVALNGVGSNFYIGALGDAISSSYINGWIQDFRVTTGLARYTANFTPPTKPLEG